MFASKKCISKKSGSTFQKNLVVVSKKSGSTGTADTATAIHYYYTTILLYCYTAILYKQDTAILLYCYTL